MIDLYTAPTPNGHKASVTLEELELPYEAHFVNIGAGEQNQDWYLELNPNGRIPTIVDRDADNLVVFDSGAIMVYLAERAGRLLPTSGPARARTLTWLAFQLGHVGPMMGQANVFYRYFPEKIEPVIDRYQNECRRLFEVLDRQLGQSEWLANEFSIADIANWCWVRTYKWSGVSRDGLEHLDRWLGAMKQRPACRRGVQVPFTLPDLTAAENKEAAEEFRKSAQRIIKR